MSTFEPTTISAGLLAGQAVQVPGLGWFEVVGTRIASPTLRVEDALSASLNGKGPRPDIEPPWSDWVEQAIAGQSVRIPEFGTLSVTRSKVRMGRNPGTGEPIQVGGRAHLQFRFNRVFKDAVSLANHTLDLAGLDSVRDPTGKRCRVFLLEILRDRLRMPSDVPRDLGEADRMVELLCAPLDDTEKSAVPAEDLPSTEAISTLAALALQDPSTFVVAAPDALAALFHPMPVLQIQRRLNSALLATEPQLRRLAGEPGPIEVWMHDDDQIAYPQFPEDGSRAADEVLLRILSAMVPALEDSAPVRQALRDIRDSVDRGWLQNLLEDLAGYWTIRHQCEGFDVHLQSAAAAGRLVEPAGSHSEHMHRIQEALPFLLRPMGQEAAQERLDEIVDDVALRMRHAWPNRPRWCHVSPSGLLAVHNEYDELEVRDEHDALVLALRLPASPPERPRRSVLGWVGEHIVLRRSPGASPTLHRIEPGLPEVASLPDLDSCRSFPDGRGAMFSTGVRWGVLEWTDGELTSNVKRRTNELNWKPLDDQWMVFTCQDDTLKFRPRAGRKRRKPIPFLGPVGVVSDSDGFVVVGEHDIAAFDPQGTVVWKSLRARLQQSPGFDLHPAFVLLDLSGEVVWLQEDAHTIAIDRRTGVFLARYDGLSQAVRADGVLLWHAWTFRVQPVTGEPRLWEPRLR